MIRRRLANAWLSTVISISLVLLLVGTACLLLFNAGSVSDYFKENMQVSVMMRPDASDAQISEMQKRLAAMPFVRSSKYVSREQGAEEMAAMLGEDFLSAFETSPVPPAFDITLDARYVSADSLEAVRSRIMQCKGVDEVSYQKSLVDTLNENLGRISVYLGILILLLLFISFVLINNTVRLSVFAKRFTVHTMNLVGATRAFIRRPFMGRAVLLGLLSGMLAILMLASALFVVRKEFAQLFEIFTPTVFAAVAGIVLLSGVLICLVSTYFVVGKLVSMDKDELYY